MTDHVKTLRAYAKSYETYDVEMLLSPDTATAIADRIEKLEAALREIVEDAEDEFASAMDMGWIARQALEETK